MDTTWETGSPGCTRLVHLDSEQAGNKQSNWDYFGKIASVA